ncbi:hypothetical protein ACIRPT_40370 [Streptomyces sp. NPDC101227]|uniref:hypothetical protein n=1 Tax=Streptomyces sp. NPDC101227 TaxID=3366136 RepID=UPI0037F10B6B
MAQAYDVVGGQSEAKLPAPPEIAARLSIATGDLCVRTRYVAARMAHIGITVTQVVEVPRPVQLDRAQAQLLAGATVGSLATVIARTHYDTDGRPVETADIIAPAGGTSPTPSPQRRNRTTADAPPRSSGVPILPCDTRGAPQA